MDPSAGGRHLAQCPACRQRLEELRAVRQRLQTAFASVKAPSQLAQRLRAAVQAQAETPRPIHVVPAWRMRVHRWIPAMIAAAALLVAIPTFLFLTQPSSAQAAQQELVNIHKMNLADGQHFYSEDEPAKLAQYFKDKLGFVPAMPQLNQGVAIRGCCVAHFQGQIVGSYVVDTPRGLISIIAVRATPAELNLTTQTSQNDLRIYQGTFATNQMAAVRVADYTYCAVGEVPQESLTQLLGLLVR
jgi:hypothetical protein